MRLFIGSSPLVLRAVANMPICRCAYRTSGESGSSVPAPQVLKKKKFNAGACVPRTEVLRHSSCQEQKGAIVNKCSAPLWLAKALKSRRGGGFLEAYSVLLFFFLPPNLKL